MLIDIKNIIGGRTILRGTCCSDDVVFVCWRREYIVYELHADARKHITNNKKMTCVAYLRLEVLEKNDVSLL
jgi:hypothetical protein